MVDGLIDIIIMLTALLVVIFAPILMWEYSYKDQIKKNCELSRQIGVYACDE